MREFLLRHHATILVVAVLALLTLPTSFGCESRESAHQKYRDAEIQQLELQMIIRALEEGIREMRASNRVAEELQKSPYTAFGDREKVKYLQSRTDSQIRRSELVLERAKEEFIRCEQATATAKATYEWLAAEH